MTISATSLSKLFTLTDTDKNSKLSATEMADIEDSLPNPQGADAATMVKNMDQNGDGLLTEDEFTQGVQLNEKVNNALLSAQEIMSGSTLLSMLSGNSDSNSSNSLASLYGNTDTDASTMFASSTDSTTSALLQQYIDKYGALDDTTAADTATDTKTTTEA
jgi:hypothetical protein